MKKVSKNIDEKNHMNFFFFEATKSKEEKTMENEKSGFSSVDASI